MMATSGLLRTIGRGDNMNKVYCDCCEYIRFSSTRNRWECFSPLNHSKEEQTNPTYYSENRKLVDILVAQPSILNIDNTCQMFEKKNILFAKDEFGNLV